MRASAFAYRASKLLRWAPTRLEACPELGPASYPEQEGRKVMGEGRIVFTNANLLDGDNAAQPGMSVTVEGNRITSISAEAVPTSAEDRVIDLSGKTLMPGLISSHFHTGFGPAPEQAPPMLGLDSSLPYMGMIGVMNMRIALDSGVTSIIGSSNPGYLDVALNEAMILGIAEGPRITPCSHELVASGDMADGTNRAWYMELGQHGLTRRVDGVDAMRQTVREEAGRGCKVIKISVSPGHGSHPAYDRVYYTQDEINTAVETATEYGAFVRAHTASTRSVIACASAGVRIIDHADCIDQQGIDLVLEKGAFITPSMLWTVRYLQFADSWDHATSKFPIGDGFPETLDVTLERLEAVRRDFEYTAGILPEMEKAGVQLLVGDDFGYPMMPHGDYVSEFEIYTKEIGIPALSVIRWATKNGAAAMGMADEVGTIEEGKLADLLVVDGDPTADISCLRTQIQVVMQNGKIVRDRLGA